MNSLNSLNVKLSAVNHQNHEDFFLEDKNKKQSFNKLTKNCFEQINLSLKFLNKHLKLKSYIVFTSFIHFNLTKISFLKFNHFKAFFEQIGNVINLHSTTLNQSFDETTFNFLIYNLTINKKIKMIALNKKLITSSQKIKLEQLVNGVRKGLTIKNINGEKFGPAFVDWTYYNESTKTSFLKGLRETAEKAFNIFKYENVDILPYVCDFGCGTGRDSIPLAMLGCKIHSIDSNDAALKIFLENISKYLPLEKQKNITIINDAELETELCIEKNSIDILVASYTFPYRPKELFESCFSQYVSFLKPGGFLAAQFFGPFEKASESMTYHTKKDLKILFNKYGLELLQLRTEKQKDIVVYGGDEPFCGDLYHLVGRKPK